MAASMLSTADPTSGTGLITEGLMTAVALAEQFILISLTDTVDLFDTPVIYYSGDANGKGSNVLRHRLWNLGWGTEMSATANEDTDVSASSLTGATSDVTIARRALRLDETQLTQIVGNGLGFDPEQVGMTMAGSFRAGRMTALATTIAGATTNVTSTGTGSLADLMDCIDQFAANGYEGLLFGMLHTFTKASIRDDMQSYVGPAKERGDVQQFKNMGAEDLYGIMCFGTNRVTTAASKHENAIMAAGAINYAIGSTGSVRTSLGAIRPAGLPVVIDFDLDSSKAVEEIVGNGYDGQAIREQTRIVGLLAANA